MYEGDNGITEIELDVFDFYEEDLVNALVDSLEELTCIREGVQDRNKTLAKIAERATYEGLKIKYEEV